VTRSALQQDYKLGMEMKTAPRFDRIAAALRSACICKCTWIECTCTRPYVHILLTIDMQISNATWQSDSHALVPTSSSSAALAQSMSMSMEHEMSNKVMRQCMRWASSLFLLVFSDFLFRPIHLYDKNWNIFIICGHFLLGIRCQFPFAVMLVIIDERIGNWFKF
jgi:hypothetical protein